MVQIWIDAEPGDNAEICVVFQGAPPIKKQIGKATAVQAKYTAIIQALSLLTTEREKKAKIFTDDKYIADTMSNGTRVNGKYPSHVRLARKAISLKKKIQDFEVILVPTEKLRKMTGM
jgi:ribonuclease HI